LCFYCNHGFEFQLSHKFDMNVLWLIITFEMWIQMQYLMKSDVHVIHMIKYFKFFYWTMFFVTLNFQVVLSMGIMKVYCLEMPIPREKKSFNVPWVHHILCPSKFSLPTHFFQFFWKGRQCKCDFFPLIWTLLCDFLDFFDFFSFKIIM